MPDIHMPKLALLFLYENPSVQSLFMNLLEILLEQAQLMPEHDPFVWIHAQLYAQPICQSGPTASHQSLHFSAGIQQTRCQVHISWVFYGIHREALTVWFRPQFSATCQNELFHFCTTNARLREIFFKKGILRKSLGFHVLNENPMDLCLG